MCVQAVVCEQLQHINFWGYNMSVLCVQFILQPSRGTKKEKKSISAALKTDRKADRLISWSFRHSKQLRLVCGNQLAFAAFQEGSNRHFLVWVLTHWHECWSATQSPRRWISLFIFQIRLTIMDGGQWPKKIITYPLTQAPAYTLLFLNYQLTDRPVETGSRRSPSLPTYIRLNLLPLTPLPPLGLSRERGGDWVLHCFC